MTAFFRYQIPGMSDSDRACLMSFNERIINFSQHRNAFRFISEVSEISKSASFYVNLAYLRILLLYGFEDEFNKNLLTFKNDIPIGLPLNYQCEVSSLFEFVGLNSTAFDRELELSNRFVSYFDAVNLLDSKDVINNIIRFDPDKPTLSVGLTKSGFFSVIETICMAYFCASRYNCNVVFQQGREFWPYPIAISEIFPFIQFLDVEEVTFNSRSLRTHFYSNFPLQKDFVIFRIQFYRYITDSISHFLMTRGYLDPDDGTKLSLFVYLRGGDKFHYEGIPTATFLYQIAAHEVILRSELRTLDIKVSSDDYTLAQQFVETFPFPASNVEIARGVGYFMNEVPLSTDNVFSLLRSFILGVRASFVIGDASSNYINAMSWARASRTPLSTVLAPTRAFPTRIFYGN